MNIALFADTIDIRNGYGNIVYEYSRCLQQSGTNFTLYLPRCEEQRVRQLGVIHAVKCILPNPVFRLYQAEGWKYLFQSVDVSGHTLVHAPFSFPYCIPALRTAKKYKLPFITGAQGTYGVLPLTQFPERRFLRRAYDEAVAIAVPSVYTADMIQKYAGRTYAIDIIHNGVRFHRFATPVDTSALQKKYAGKHVLLTVGGLKTRKGQDLVIRALQDIRKKRSDIVYVIVGEGNTRSSLEKLAQECGVSDLVEFTGNKTGEELVAYYQACSMYVHTPRVVNLQFEGFGIVYLEAGACGKPSVATDAGGIRDAVVDGETGLVVPDGDVEGIVRSILRLLEDDAFRMKLGTQAMEYARAHDWPAIADQYLSLYRRFHA